VSDYSGFDEFLDSEGDDDADTSQQQKPNGPGDLRKAYAKEKKERAAIQKQLDELLAEKHERTLSEALTSRGLSPKVAKLAKAAGVTGDDLESWLEEYADVIGAPAPTEPNETQTATTDMDRAESGGSAQAPGGLTEEKIAAMPWDEFQALLAANKGHLG